MRLRVNWVSLVAGIVAIGLPQIVEIGQQLGAAKSQQGPNQRGRAQGPRPGHPGQSADARAAKDAVQDRFGLVVGGMGGDDIAGPAPGGRRFEELVACLPGRRLEPVAAGRAGQIDLHAADFARHAQPPAEIDDHRLVGVRLAGAQDG